VTQQYVGWRAGVLECGAAAPLWFFAG